MNCVLCVIFGKFNEQSCFVYRFNNFHSSWKINIVSLNEKREKCKRYTPIPIHIMDAVRF